MHGDALSMLGEVKIHYHTVPCIVDLRPRIDVRQTDPVSVAV
jgi:hypothetical protein